MAPLLLRLHAEHALRLFAAIVTKVLRMVSAALRLHDAVDVESRRAIRKSGMSVVVVVAAARPLGSGRRTRPERRYALLASFARAPGFLGSRLLPRRSPSCGPVRQRTRGRALWGCGCSPWRISVGPRRDGGQSRAGGQPRGRAPTPRWLRPRTLRHGSQMRHVSEMRHTHTHTAKATPAWT